VRASGEEERGQGQYAAGQQQIVAFDGSHMFVAEVCDLEVVVWVVVLGMFLDVAER
jgi:hypothetical protein